MLDRLLLPWRKPAEKAASGIGATWMTNEPPLRLLTGGPEQKAKAAQDVGVSHRWIRAAERVISTSLGSVDWHLETDDDEPITPESPELLRSVHDVLEKPYRPKDGEPLRPYPRTRSGLWGITSRHMGLCGYSFWYADEPNAYRIPSQLLYINPARMSPAGEKGSLMGWILDKDARGGGVPLEAAQVLMFTLEEADFGWFPAGLVETAMSLVNITRSSDRHAAGTIGSGGKRPGVFSPKNDVMPPDVYLQLQKDLRSSHEDPDSWRRDMILRGPIEYTDRAATNEQLDLVALMNLSRDDTLELWGVPRSQLGGSAPVGLNSGSTKSYDEAALWQKAIAPRLERMRETIQFQLLDPIAEKLNKALELEIEEPTFDDDAPKYELANSALNLPLRNVERRALIGLDPLGDEVLDNSIWLPLNIVEAAAAPQAKAKLTLSNLAPKLAKQVADFLAEQQREITQRVRANAKHVSAKPGDSSAWWDGTKWDAQLRKLLAPYMASAADLAVSATQGKLGAGKAGEAADLLGNRVLQRILAVSGSRITGINDTTRQGVLDAIRAGVEAGEGPSTIGDRIEDLPDGIFGEYRGELIARTETGTILNLASVESYREFGVNSVSVIDGDQDDECASANGATWSLEEAQSNPLGHPNCTRDFSPIVGKAVALSGYVQPPALPDPMAEVKALIAELAARIDNRPTMGSMTIPSMTLSPVFNIPEQLPPIVNVEAQPAPVVHVAAPEVTVNVPEQPTTVVNVPAPIVNVDTAGKAATVQDVRVVEMPVRTTTASKKVKRDRTTQLITEVIETSVEE